MADELPDNEQNMTDDAAQVDGDAGEDVVEEGIDNADASTEAEGALSAAEQTIADLSAHLSSESETEEAASDPVVDPMSQPLNLPDFASAGTGSSENDSKLSLLNEVNLRVKVELGRTHLYVEDILKMTEDSVIELDKAAGDPVDVYVNERHVARGEVLVVNDNFCVRISEIVQNAVHEY